MKHSNRCLQLETDELLWLCQSGLVTPIAIPQSLTDLVAHWPADAPGVPNASNRLMAKLNLAVRQRADTRADYAWPYSSTPPNWTKAPQQVVAQAPITPPSESGGEVQPPAPWPRPRMRPAPPDNAKG